MGKDCLKISQIESSESSYKYPLNSDVQKNVRRFDEL